MKTQLVEGRIDISGELATIQNDLSTLTTERKDFADKVRNALEHAIKSPEGAGKQAKKISATNKKLTKMMASIDATKIDSAKDMKKIWKNAQSLLKQAGSSSSNTEIVDLVKKFEMDLKRTDKDIRSVEQKAKIKHSLVGKIKDAFATLKVSRMTRHSEKVIERIDKQADKFNLDEADQQLLNTHRQLAAAKWK